MKPATKRTLEYGIAVFGTISTVVLLNQGAEYLRKKVNNDKLLALAGGGGIVVAGVLMYILETKFNKNQ